MTFIIDENLPKSLALWLGIDAAHVRDLGLKDDEAIWTYAVQHNSVIITKDTDFFHLASSSTDAKVIKLEIGNLRLQALKAFLLENWSAILNTLENCHYVQVWSKEIRGLRS